MAPLTREQVTNIGTALAGNKEARDIAVSAAQDKISRQSETASSVGGNLAAGVTTINSNNLKPTPVVNPPALPPNPTNTRINAATNISEAQAIPPKAPATSLQDKTQQFLQDQLGEGGQINTQAVREELRLDEKRQRANDLDNKVIATKRRYEDQIAELEKNAQGNFGGALAGRINQLSQEANKELANLSFQYKIANDDLNGARETYNARVADMKDFRNYQFQVNRAIEDSIENDWTESEKAIFLNNEKIQASETAFEQQKELASYNAQLSRSNAVFEAKLEADAVSASQISINDLIGTPEGANAKISDQAIVGSGNFDKELDISAVESINQAKLALSGVETLQGFLAQGDDGLNLTGPVKGRVRNFITKLGGDADAAGINAALQGLIPTVARGIFGEVGVLTDTDIENYKKTLPNLTSDEDQNDLITIIMLDVLENSFTNTLKSNAQAGRNTSRFYPDLLEIRSRVSELKLGMGVTSFSGQSNEDFFDSVPQEETAGIETTLGTFNPQNFTNFINN